jgi:Arc/MetJ-type ribon-helix-helix transcriptional regulator
MDPITLRLPANLLEELDEEADAAGYSSRSEYIRHLLWNRRDPREFSSSNTSVNIPNSNSGTDSNREDTSLREQVATVDDRIDELEAEVEAIRSKLDQQTSSRSDDEKEPEQIAGSDTDPQSGTAHADDTEQQKIESDEDSFGALDTWLEQNGPQSDEAKAVLREVAEILDSEGPLSPNELKSRLFEQYPEAYSSPRALWSATVERYHEEIPGFEKPKYGTYTFNSQ